MDEIKERREGQRSEMMKKLKDFLMVKVRSIVCELFAFREWKMSFSLLGVDNSHKLRA